MRKIKPGRVKTQWRLDVERGKMATYLKRTSKLFDLTLPQASFEMNLRDLMCPVCRGILIEPVTLPCTHNLCLRCLKGTFEHNSLSCPLCRVRVGSWLRTATKSESLVNGSLWQYIRSRFPKEIQNKSNDDVTDIDENTGEFYLRGNKQQPNLNFTNHNPHYLHTQIDICFDYNCLFFFFC